MTKIVLKVLSSEMDPIETRLIRKDLIQVRNEFSPQTSELLA